MTVEKLAAIQGELKAPKGQYNSFGKYNYRSCEDILEAVKPILQTNQAAVMLSDEIVNIGNRFYIKATATLKDSEGEISATAYAREDDTKKGMDGSQITGSASSYARKYALNGLFAIDDTKDSDSTNNGENAPVNGKQGNTGNSPKNTQTGDSAANTSLEYALNYEVEIGGKKYKLGALNETQLNWLDEHANDELKKLINRVFADRMQNSETEDIPF